MERTTLGKKDIVDKATRHDELKAMLDERREVILREVRSRIQGVRSEGEAKREDPPDSDSPDIQEDIEFALIQMKAETLNKITEALARLDEGGYGFCANCGDEIVPARLCALPFAQRCKDCEEEIEFAEERDRSASRSSSRYSGFTKKPSGR